MNSIIPTIKTILLKYRIEPHAPITAGTPLSDLAIDCLDLPMIFLDIEDAFDVQISYVAETDRKLTVGGLIDCVADRIAAKRDASALPRVYRPKRNWMSTGADR